MKLLVVGLRGTGVEIAKNCLLQGVSSLTLYDPKPVAISDTGANFFLGADDVGSARDAVCRPRLQELNPEAAIVVVRARRADGRCGCGGRQRCGGGGGECGGGRVE